jgi:hypothetical protein
MNLSGGGTAFKVEIFKNNVQTDIKYNDPTGGTNIQVSMNGTIQLVEGDALDIRYTCANN